jgi:hypothetical protein
VGYGRADIRVVYGSTVTLGGSASDGCRAFATLVNLTTGKYVTEQGSWGGPNMFTSNAVDADRSAYPLPADGVAIVGSIGGGRPVYATLHAPASMVALMLPAPGPALSHAETVTLHCFARYTSAYRREALSRAEIGPEVIDALVDRGLLKRNRAGATAITTDGKNALATSIHPVKAY